MESLMPIKLICQLDKVITTKDGGGKITLEFGHESLKAIQALQTLNGSGDTCLAAVFVPFLESSSNVDWDVNLDSVK